MSKPKNTIGNYIKQYMFDLAYKRQKPRIDELNKIFADVLRQPIDVRLDEQENIFVEVIFKEATQPDLTKLPPKIGPWPVQHDFRKPFLNFGEMKALHDLHEQDIKKAVDALDKGMIGLAMNCDEKTSQPRLIFIFEKSSKPDLSKVPSEIGPFKVVTEFRQRPKLG